jgi:SAM-dependent methyltransferase
MIAGLFGIRHDHVGARTESAVEELDQAGFKVGPTLAVLTGMRDAGMQHINYHSRIVRRESRQAAALVARHVGIGTTVLDVGCGEGYVGAELGARGAAVELVDIVDVRRVSGQPSRAQHFQLFDGLNLPFPDASFEVVMLNFVLHHVPDDRKAHLLKEAARVSRDKVFILEDTPRNLFDRLMNRRHGQRYRDKIGSRAPFGFLTSREWEWLFMGLGFLLRDSRILGRFCRAPWQPFARSAFLLQVRGCVP